MEIIPITLKIWNRGTHIIKERERIRTLENAIKSIRLQYDVTKKKRMPHFLCIFNLSLYVLVFEYDFTILRTDALFAIRLWKKQFIARQMAILLYEVSHDLPNLLGKDFRESLKTISLPESEWNELNRISKALNKFKNEQHDFLNELRNFVGAHRDNDAGKQLEIIEKIELLEMMKIGEKFYDAFRDLIPFLTRIIMQLTDYKIILKHLPPNT